MHASPDVFQAQAAALGKVEGTVLKNLLLKVATADRGVEGCGTVQGSAGLMRRSLGEGCNREVWACLLVRFIKEAASDPAYPSPSRTCTRTQDKKNRLFLVTALAATPINLNCEPACPGSCVRRSLAHRRSPTYIPDTHQE